MRQEDPARDGAKVVVLFQVKESHDGQRVVCGSVTRRNAPWPSNMRSGCRIATSLSPSVTLSQSVRETRRRFSFFVLESKQHHQHHVGKLISSFWHLSGFDAWLSSDRAGAQYIQDTSASSKLQRSHQPSFSEADTI